MRCFRGEYFYKIIASDLRQATIFKNDAYNFVNISKNLIESTDPDSILMLNNKSNNVTFVPMDKQLHDFMIDFPSHKTWLIRVCNFNFINYKFYIDYYVTNLFFELFLIS